ncbi:MAG: hypothetical protein JST89_12725 [Cyanobacteria bacterium SZAS-4]|nr:hypothetical protein [Cyanobacteria bacterium SZAS-4]
MITRKQLLALVGFVILGAIIIWIGRDDPSQRPKIEEQPPVQTPVTQPSTQSDFNQITLPHDDPEFPPGPGRELFLARCTVCHSLRYITMQPNFSKKVWAKEVAKMINTYKAHITGEEAREIINYLATVKGTDQDGASNSKLK